RIALLFDASGLSGCACRCRRCHAAALAGRAAVQFRRARQLGNSARAANRSLGAPCLATSFQSESKGLCTDVDGCRAMIDFKQIDAFVWVAELGSFRAAAEKLNTTQPAISQRIAALEATMSVRLFERGARGIKLTEKGQELLSHAQRMLALRNEMMTVAKAQNAVRGTLRLGSS